MKDLKEKKLIIGFGIFLIITITIGVIGIVQIYTLTNIIQELGTRNLPRERVILEMKINNTLYATGVRNFVMWRTSKYLPAASLAPSIDEINKFSLKFKNNLKVYNSLTISNKQKIWVNDLKELMEQVKQLGTQLIEISQLENANKDKVNKLFVAFENKLYSIDDFLVETLSRDNITLSQEQLRLTNNQKKIAVAILLISLIASIILGCTITYLVYKSLKEERQHRERLVQHMIKIEEEERKSLSRQIHDQLSQDLGALKIYLELIEKDIGNASLQQKEKLEKSKKILSNLIDKSHNISELLRPPQLDEIGLIESIDSLIAEYSSITEPEYIYNRPNLDITLSSEYSLAFYRVVQEALTNIVKYAQAKNVEISLSSGSDKVYLSVVDDGVGFDYQSFLKRPDRRHEDKIRLGLQGLRERIELLGGKFIVITSLGKGTRIKVEFDHVG